ncbi:MAG: protein-glutamate O-methyltransferase CheR [Anaerolineales bacterium]
MTGTWQALYQYSQQDVDLLAALIQQRLGLSFNAARYDWMLERVLPLLSERGLDSLRDYYYLLKYDPAGETEWEQLAHVLTTNETYFWREFERIRIVAENIVPDLQRRYPNQAVRIWHAACSSGEEPYSMAIALLERARFLYGAIDILGTDIDKPVLAQAQAGVYGERSFRGIPPEIQQRYFQASDDGRTLRISAAVQRRVRLEVCNLVDARQVAALGRFNIIFCRNVWIYFSEQVSRQVAENLYNALLPEGIVCLGAAESLLRYPQWFTLLEIEGALLYRRVAE